MNCARNVLLTLQNTSAVKAEFTVTLNDTANEVFDMTSKVSDSSSSSKTISGPALNGFLTMIEEFQQYAVTNIKIPFQVVYTLFVAFFLILDNLNFDKITIRTVFFR